jgi:hypothetical protein
MARMEVIILTFLVMGRMRISIGAATATSFSNY